VIEQPSNAFWAASIRPAEPTQSAKSLLKQKRSGRC
jgi:hypothetical protein